MTSAKATGDSPSVTVGFLYSTYSPHSFYSVLPYKVLPFQDCGTSLKTFPLLTLFSDFSVFLRRICSPPP